VRDATDRAREEAYWEATLRVQLERGMLAPIRAAAFAIFGPTPLALARWTPKAWPQLFPDGPQTEFVEGEEGSAVVRLSGWVWDDEVLDIFRTALHGVFSGFLDMTERRGEVTSEVEEAGALFLISWS